MQVVMHADASREVGTGHVTRCLALAQALKVLDDAEVTIAADSMLPHLRERANRLGVAVLERSDAPRRPDWVVVDSYSLSAADRQGLSEPGTLWLVVDDAGTGPIEAEVVLNQNLYASAIGPSTASTGELAAGPAFALLSAEYAAARSVSPAAGRAARILVTMGGSDPHDATTAAVRSLAPLGARSDVRVVLGPGHPDRQAVISSSEDVGFTVVESPLSLAEHLSWADIVVAGCGTTVLEAARLGRPIVGVVLANNQEAVAAAVVHEDLGVVVGRHPGFESPSLLAAVSTLLADPPRREAISHRGQRLVDGRGALRVAQIMRTGPMRLREATIDDAELLLAWRNDAVSRAASFGTSPIGWSQHLAWLKDQLSGADTNVWLGTLAEVPIGVVRFSIAGDLATISVNVAPDRRGHGFGLRLIISGCARLIRERAVSAVQAWIRPDNTASIHAFQRAGFRHTDATHADRLLFRLGPVPMR